MRKGMVKQGVKGKKLRDLSISELRSLLRDDSVCKKIAYTVTHMDGDLMDAVEAMGFDPVKFGTLLAEDSRLRDRVMEFVGEESRICFREMVPLVKVRALRALHDMLSGGKGDAKMTGLALKALDVFMKHDGSDFEVEDEYDELMGVLSGVDSKKGKKNKDTNDLDDEFGLGDLRLAN